MPVPVWSAEGPVIDAEVRELVRHGRARVLVELRVAREANGPAPRPEAIETVQRKVIARLAGTQAAIVRQYASIPLVALEIDVSALARLELMADLVVRVRPDTRLRTSDAPAPVRPRED